MPHTAIFFIIYPLDPSGNLIIFNIAIENGPFVLDLPTKDCVFSIVMLVYQRVVRTIISKRRESNYHKDDVGEGKPMAHMAQATRALSKLLQPKVHHASSPNLIVLVSVPHYCNPNDLQMLLRRGVPIV